MFYVTNLSIFTLWPGQVWQLFLRENKPMCTNYSIDDNLSLKWIPKGSSFGEYSCSSTLKQENIYVWVCSQLDQVKWQIQYLSWLRKLKINQLINFCWPKKDFIIRKIMFWWVMRDCLVHSADIYFKQWSCNSNTCQQFVVIILNGIQALSIVCACK